MKYYEIEYVTESGETVLLGEWYEDVVPLVMEAYLVPSEIPTNLLNLDECWITFFDGDYEVEILEREQLA